MSDSTTDPGFITTVTLVLEKTLNTALKFDPGTRGKLAAINGKVLAVQVLQPAFTFYLRATGDQLDVLGYCETPANATLSGTAADIGRLAMASNSSLADSGVRVEGEVGLLNHYQQLIRELDIDWEDALAGLMGDLPAHQFATLARSAIDWLKPRRQRIPLILAEFLTEELRALPPAAEQEAFGRDVASVRQQTDRLEARIRKLQQQTQQQ